MNTEKDTLVEYSGEWWCNEIVTAEEELNKKWRESADKVVARYLDERDDTESMQDSRKYNIFWANTQILKSALYASPPKPVVSRQFNDAKDDVARTAALIIQRILALDIQKDDSDMHESFLLATEDRLVPGLGQVWLRYEVETEKFQTPEIRDPMTGAVLVLSQEAERVVFEDAPVDYVHWRDFIWSPARTWKEVWWVARRVFMRKDKFVKRFGEEKYADVKQGMTLAAGENGYPKYFKKGKVQLLEIWCKATNKVYFINLETKLLIEEKDDPLKLEGFFPCPKPLLATHSTKNLIPRPDFVMAQDQYYELDVLNDRISLLTGALRVVGAYDATNTSLAKMLTGPELSMVPVDKWAMLAESGGIKGVVDWFPVEQVAKVLAGLVDQRMLVVQQIYELTSISDIIRGASNPRETLGAQKLKAQYSSVRLRLTQQDVAKFVCQAMRIKAEIISKWFQPETIAHCSLIEETESAEFAQPAIQLLKDYGVSKYRIKVSEETLSMADYTAEREMRIEYLTAVGQFLSQAGQITKAAPGALPYLIKMVTWVTASFRGGDDIETVLDEASKLAQNMPPPQEGNPPPPDHSIEVATIQAKTTLDKADKDNMTKLEIARLDREMNERTANSDREMSERTAESAEKKDAVTSIVKSFTDALTEQTAVLKSLSEAVSALAIKENENASD